MVEISFYSHIKQNEEAPYVNFVYLILSTWNTGLILLEKGRRKLIPQQITQQAALTIVSSKLAIKHQRENVSRINV